MILFDKLHQFITQNPPTPADTSADTSATERMATSTMVQQDLDELAELRQRRREMLEQIPEILRAQLAAIDEDMSDLEEQIKADCVAIGASVQGAALQVCFVPGKENWDTKGLRGYAKDHPAILEFVTLGKPYACIRAMPKNN